MKNYLRTDFNEYWPLVESGSYFQQPNLGRFSDLLGFHVYADLRLNLDVAAAEDAGQAMRCVDILEDFTAISNQCAGLVGARLLEVQGERIHFALPAQEPAAGLGKLLVFSSALTQTVFHELKPSAGEDWQGFSMAADFGPAVLIPSSFGGGSLVSLGNAANQPAKRLGSGVTSGHLALPEGIGKELAGARASGRWVEIDVHARMDATKEFFDDKLTEDMQRAAQTILRQRTQKETRNFAGALADNMSFAKTPLRIRGMCLRADLDGFTKGVEQAFKNNQVPDLVRQFGDVMQYPLEFVKKLGRPHVEIPWAGDCCTLLVQPGASETVEQMRASLPVVAGRNWHGIAYENGGRTRWGTSMGSAKWALGMACGDREEGGNGNAIITEFPAAGRSFRVIVGWCSRRAKDAQETSGIKGDEIAIPVVDYQNLEAVFKPLFEPIGSIHRYSNYAKLKHAAATASKQLATSTTKRLAGISTVLPAPRPYWK